MIAMILFFNNKYLIIILYVYDDVILTQKIK